MFKQASLIIQVPRDSAIEQQLREDFADAVRAGEILVQAGPTDAHGALEALAGEVVVSVPSPQELLRISGGLRRVLHLARTGSEPLVLLVEAAEELQDAEVSAVLAAARGTSRGVILRIVRPSEPRGQRPASLT